MRVLEAGEGLGLARALAGHLQRDEPIGELTFARQEDPGERPASQLLDQVKPADRLAGLGERDPGAPGWRTPGRPRPSRPETWSRSSRPSSRSADGYPARGGAAPRAALYLARKPARSIASPSSSRRQNSS